MQLSLCMIVKNEEDVLPRCLDSVKNAVDEIVIVDTGSTDATRAIAAHYTDKIYDEPWQDDFARARNVSFQKAHGDYLMWLDADDVIAPDQLPRLFELKKQLARDPADMVVCGYAGGGLSFRRERIVRRCEKARWVGRVHECISPFGRVIGSDFTVTHLRSNKPRGARNLHIYQKWRAEEPLSPRDLFYYGRELYYNRLYTEAIAVLEEMLAGEGWHVNQIEACKVLASCYAAKGERIRALNTLFRSFAFGLPRGGVCHTIGRAFQEDGKLGEAVWWYERALACPDRSAEGDFDVPDERTLYPLLGLVYCNSLLGKLDTALEYHKRAAVLAPTHPSVLHNQTYFESIGMLSRSSTEI